MARASGSCAWAAARYSDDGSPEASREASRGASRAPPRSPRTGPGPVSASGKPRRSTFSATLRRSGPSIFGATVAATILARTEELGADRGGSAAAPFATELRGRVVRDRVERPGRFAAGPSSRRRARSRRRRAPSARGSPCTCTSPARQIGASRASRRTRSSGASGPTPAHAHAERRQRPRRRARRATWTHDGAAPARRPRRGAAPRAVGEVAIAHGEDVDDVCVGIWARRARDAPAWRRDP